MIDKQIALLRKISASIAAISIIILMIMTVAEVVARTFFSYSFLVVDELSGYIMAICVFFGLVYSFDSNSFVRVELLYEKYKGLPKKIIDLILLIILIVYSYGLNYFMFKLVKSSFLLDSTAPTILETPIYIPQFITLLGLIIYNLYLLLVLLKQFQSFGKENEV